MRSEPRDVAAGERASRRRSIVRIGEVRRVAIGPEDQRLGRGRGSRVAAETRADADAELLQGRDPAFLERMQEDARHHVFEGVGVIVRDGPSPTAIHDRGVVLKDTIADVAEQLHADSRTGMSIDATPIPIQGSRILDVRRSAFSGVGNLPSLTGELLRESRVDEGIEKRESTLREVGKDRRVKDRRELCVELQPSESHGERIAAPDTRRLVRQKRRRSRIARANGSRLRRRRLQRRSRSDVRPMRVQQGRARQGQGHPMRARQRRECARTQQGRARVMPPARERCARTQPGAA